MSEDFELDEALKEFLVESSEFLDQIEQDLLELEREPGDLEKVNNIFRALHTIKGNSGFLAYANLESLSHKAETLLDLVRNEKLGLDSEIASTLLEVLDGIRNMLSNVESAGNDGDNAYEELHSRLDALKSKATA